MMARNASWRPLDRQRNRSAPWRAGTTDREIARDVVDAIRCWLPYSADRIKSTVNGG
jgi:hypothetical protein